MVSKVKGVLVLACLPCPPGYIQRKIRPSSSAETRPAGVSSPPHFRIRTRLGSFGVSEICIIFCILGTNFDDRFDKSYININRFTIVTA